MSRICPSSGGVDGFEPRELRRGIGYVPQVRDVFETLSVQENLEMGGYTLARDAVAERIGEVMDHYPALGAMRDRPAESNCASRVP